MWHDLRKDSCDLPPRRSPITEGDVKVPQPHCSVIVLDAVGNRVWYNYLNKKWRKEPFEEIEVFAWRELPNFMEDKNGSSSFDS